MEVSGLYLGSGLSERCVGHSFDMPQPGLGEYHSKRARNICSVSTGFLSCVPRV